MMLDADGSADAGEIPAFVQALLDGADLAKGTRFARGGGSNDLTRLRAFGVSASADSNGASSLAVWAYPSGHRLLVGAQQPRGRGPASLRITVTQAGVTVAVWKDVHLAPGQTWRARPLTVPRNGPAAVVARRGGVVVASFPAG